MESTIRKSNEELAALAIDGDNEARELLASNNLGLVRLMANKFLNTGYSFDDLYSNALFGLTKAINTYKPDKGAKFTTYASRIMSNDILMFVRSNKKHKGILSLDMPIYEGEASELTLLDRVEDQTNETDEHDFTELRSIVEREQLNRNQKQRKIS